jgi:hypothetical protein
LIISSVPGVLLHAGMVRSTRISHIEAFPALAETGPEATRYLTQIASELQEERSSYIGVLSRAEGSAW